MDWSRLVSSVSGSLFVAFLLGAMVSPPDPFTQLLFVIPAFVVAVPLAFRYHSRIHGRDRVRHALFLAGPFTAQLAWRHALPATQEFSVVHVALVLAGAALGAWLAYFGGLERVRASDGATTIALAVPLAYVLATILAPNPTRLLVYATGLLIVTLPVTYHFVGGREQ